ncbi:MAG: Transposase [Parcubacteria group bacterium GW2011_GWB1_35_5]|nr:MAG: Transposase [Parcubacteria group bacterium GW2011_GWB1_35_5]
MAFRDSDLIENEYYHIYNRGNGKNKIFNSEEDYDRFTKLLYVCNSEKSFKFRDFIDQKIDAWDVETGKPLVEICSWVLMPNHFHIILVSHRSDLWNEKYNPITEFMRKLSTAYVMYFNKKYGRTGSLFEGKFKSKHVRIDNYFNYLFSYIHLNPVKLIQSDWKENGIKNKKETLSYLVDFAYSSFQDFYGISRKEGRIINKDSLPESFKYNHVNELFEWIIDLPQVGPV